MNHLVFRNALKLCIIKKVSSSVQVNEFNSISKAARNFSIYTRCLNEKKPTLDDILKEDDKEQEAKQKKSMFNERTVSFKTRLAIVSVITAAVGSAWYVLKSQKEERDIIQLEEECSKVDIGKVDFELTDHNGNRVTKDSFLGKWLLLYFGFTHCPDICPEELDRITDIVTKINGDKGTPDLQPVFMSVDPRRDTPEAMTEYLKDFHPSFVGLTGTEEEIKKATKSFRVYYSLGPKDDDNDYIVDHSIIIYLMDPRGNFVDYYGSRSTPTTDVVSGITKRMKNYKRLHG